MLGNGLRPQIWPEFIKRFGIRDIAEFYGSTEGSSNCVNIENKVGAVGFAPVAWPRFLKTILLPLDVIKVDKTTGEPLRDPTTGLCQVADPGEEGELVGKIIRGDPVKDFKGYQDSTATNKKILSDVFKKGDIYFRSGDSMVMDELGWLYFKDRFGDTFR